MQKPKPFVYWTNKHRTHYEMGVLVIGRQVIPLVLINVLLLIIELALVVYGIIAAPKQPGSVRIASAATFEPALWFFLAVASVYTVCWVAAWIVGILKNARSGLDD